MSDAAGDLLELIRLAKRGVCSVTEKRLHEVAARIIASGLRDERGGL